ncbi:hypothetical protein QZH41_007633 [Actinostola sp. cb2023]|nr:hypothetical protein QZH41_007633 [Actinostola sp. cb2023]
MNRRTTTLLPTTSVLLQPRVVYPETVKYLNRRKQQQSTHFNRNTRDLPTLDEGDTVRMKPFTLGEKRWKKATVTSRLDERSYVVETPEGDEYRRNRSRLKKTSDNLVTMATADVAGMPCRDRRSHSDAIIGTRTAQCIGGSTSEGADDGLYVDGVIEGMAVRFLVDTGASVTMLKSSIYK